MAGEPGFDPARERPRVWSLQPGDLVCFGSFQQGEAMSDQVQASETEQGKYVYCIIKTEAQKDFGPVGIGGRGDRVYSVQYREFAAVVSNCPLIVFDPTRENALAHEHV
ncbi:MAG: hypothetical protein QOH21_3359, partial [Acidobacteriota bacterium]|nr:hypothetical protein [Acidobacteriota bacterium]